MEQDEVVHDQDKDALVEDLEGFSEGELIELCIPQVDHVQQRREDHELDLDAGLLEQSEGEQDEEGSSSEEHG